MTPKLFMLLDCLSRRESIHCLGTTTKGRNVMTTYCHQEDASADVLNMMDTDAVPFSSPLIGIPKPRKTKTAAVYHSKCVKDRALSLFCLLLEYRFLLGCVFIVITILLPPKVPGNKWEIPHDGPLHQGVLVGMQLMAYALAQSLQYLMNFAKEICCPTIQNVKRSKEELFKSAMCDKSLWTGPVGIVIILLTTDFDQVSIVQYVRPLFLGTFALFSSFNLKEITSLERLKLSKESSVGIGRMFACGFYFGYLKLIMSSGMEFIKRGEQFEEREKTTLCSKQLNIIIPHSCQAPVQLVGPDDDRIEAAGKLPPMKLNRGGVIEREFHNSVYRINREKENKRHLYLIAEVATPLLTLREICEHGTSDMKLSHTELKEERELFCQTLENFFAKDEICGKLCKLVRVPDKEDSETGIASKISDELVKAVTMSNNEYFIDMV